MSFHDWEKTPNFDPAKISVNSPRWVNFKGSLLTEAQEMADNAHISQDFISSPQLCPVRAIETYVAVASELRVTLSNGYLFRPTNHQGHIVNKPLTSSSAEARLKYYLKDAKIDEGETLHGFRSGSAITLALSG